mgnify:CR=1 FL=1|tara:strand:- start:1051 stop:1302 length:252 start_codon:yes stop_codon:yes gene_type:complete
MDTASMSNISMETVEKPTSTQPTQPTQQSQPAQPDINSVEVRDENTALNLMVSFLHLAQKRGAFNLQESAKVWECVKMFMKQP